jgi:threonine/homoserine/homoserine lactone efflux protein
MATSLEINRKTIMRVDNQTSGFLLTVINATILLFVNTILPQNIYSEEVNTIIPSKRD